MYRWPSTTATGTGSTSKLQPGEGRGLQCLLPQLQERRLRRNRDPAQGLGGGQRHGGGSDGAHGGLRGGVHQQVRADRVRQRREPGACGGSGGAEFKRQGGPGTTA